MHWRNHISFKSGIVLIVHKIRESHKTYLQKLHEADDGDDYYNSPWANPNALKNQFHGIGNVKWGPRWATSEHWSAGHFK